MEVEVKHDDDAEVEEDRPDPFTLRLAAQHNPLLLFLHSLATASTLQHWSLAHVDIQPYVFDSMTPFPSLIILDLSHNENP